VLGDEHRLHQVMTNLLANAAAHTPSGTNVHVSVVADPAEGDTRLSITDDGPGIPAAAQPHVFERFFRGERGHSSLAGNSGLGLAIVAAVVRAHGGEVDVTSRPGDTTFTIRLPMHDSAQVGGT
jgi:two-component system OmpR family sensor kinase